MRLPSKHFAEFGIDVVFTDILYADPDNPRVRNDGDPIPLGNLALIRQSENGDIAYGIGIFSPGGFDTTVDMTWPRTLTLGVRHRASSCDTLGLDIAWYNWSAALDTLTWRIRSPMKH